SPAAAIGISANEKIELLPQFIVQSLGADYGLANTVQVLPPTVALTSLAGSVVLPALTPQLLYPSAFGQLRLFSDGSIKNLS
ncbi:hypothetical protein, partial [Escherichia coli]